MSRFEELQKKMTEAGGYLSLSKADQKEYSAIKDGLEPPKQKQETITMTKDELAAMMQGIVTDAIDKYKSEQPSLEEIGDAVKVGKWMKARDEKKQNHTANLKIFRLDGDAEAGVMIDKKFLKHGFNEETRKNDIPIYKITVLYDNGETKFHEVNWPEFMATNEFEKVEIIKQTVEPQEMTVGVGQYPASDKGYAFSNPGFFGTKQGKSEGNFDYKVIRQDITCTVKRPNGKTITLNANQLNA